MLYHLKVQKEKLSVDVHSVITKSPDCNFLSIGKVNWFGHKNLRALKLPWTRIDTLKNPLKNTYEPFSLLMNFDKTEHGGLDHTIGQNRSRRVPSAPLYSFLGSGFLWSQVLVVNAQLASVLLPCFLQHHGRTWRLLC